jgi:hypothetical protein
MIQENQNEEYESDNEHQEEAKKPSFGMSSMSKGKKAKKSEQPEKSSGGGLFSRLGDKISAGLFKASRANQNSLKK